MSVQDFKVTQLMPEYSPEHPAGAEVNFYPTDGILQELEWALSAPEGDDDLRLHRALRSVPTTLTAGPIAHLFVSLKRYSEVTAPNRRSTEFAESVLLLVGDYQSRYSQDGDTITTDNIVKFLDPNYKPKVRIKRAASKVGNSALKLLGKI